MTKVKCAECGFEFTPTVPPLATYILCDVCDLRDEADTLERHRAERAKESK